MFDFSRHEKIILITLSIILLTGIGLSFQKTNSRQKNPTVKPTRLEKIDLKTIDEIICDYSIININMAEAGELERLSGIGPVLAKRIVDYRQTNGLFTDKKDLLKIKGIGPKLYERLRESTSIE